MRLKLRRVSLAGFAVLLEVGGIPVDASIRPSFDLDHCSWNATHIVLVQTTSKDGVFSVVESWKGDLKPGDSAEVPGLEPDANAVPISRYPRATAYGSQGSEQIPRQPISSQLVLFLKRRQGGYAPSPLTDAGSGSQWEPASAYGGMKVSAVWIDGGKAFCFQQWMNPGPSALSECGGWQVTSADVAVLAMRIRVVLQVQQDLARTLALEDPEWRAQRLGRIAMGDIYEAQVAAIDALGEAGTVALPEILQVMDKRPGFYGGEHMIRVFVEASGRDSGRQLHARLQQDLIYWKAIGPTLTQNWLGQLVEPGSPLFMRFHETQLLIHELDREHYAPARQTTAELRDFWISQPQLYDPKWGERDFRSGGTVNEMMRAESFELVEECDAFLKHVGAEKTAP